MSKRKAIFPAGKSDEVNIVRYGAVAIEPLTGARKAPIIGFDLSARPDLIDLIDIHEESPPGDVTTQWGGSKWKRDSLQLLFSFKRPARKDFYTTFQFCDHSWLLEGLVQSRIMLMRAGVSGESTQSMVDGIKHSITVSVAADDIPVDWESWRLKCFTKKFKALGHSRHEAKHMANQIVDSHKEFWREPVVF